MSFEKLDHLIDVEVGATPKSAGYMGAVRPERLDYWEAWNADPEACQPCRPEATAKGKAKAKAKASEATSSWVSTEATPPGLHEAEPADITRGQMIQLHDLADMQKAQTETNDKVHVLQTQTARFMEELEHLAHILRGEINEVWNSSRVHSMRLDRSEDSERVHSMRLDRLEARFNPQDADGQIPDDQASASASTQENFQVF